MTHRSAVLGAGVTGTGARMKQAPLGFDHADPAG